MKYILLISILLPLSCSIPATKVLSVHFTLESAKRENIEAVLTLLDEDDEKIDEISSGAQAEWWVHSHYAEKSRNVTIDQALEVVAVKVVAQGCEPKVETFEIESDYKPLSFDLHGGGPAYMYYSAQKVIMLDCG